MVQAVALTGNERFFAEDEIIVSKTDTAGRITYANDVFLRMAGFTEEELLGQPHSIIRHPDMPRCVFKLLWDTIENGDEIFAFVINRAKNGDHYWVLAHVTPTFDTEGATVGYHSSRRVPNRDGVEKISGIYAQLLAEEARHRDSKEGMQASFKMMVDLLDQHGIRYDQFVFALERGR